MATRSEIEQFIAASCRSVWALELLCLLRANGERMSHAEMVTALRASDMIIAQSLVGLTASGLVVADAEGGAIYAPIAGDLDALVAEAGQFYSKSPDAVRRIIAVAWNPGLTEFADAFKFRKPPK